MSDFDADHAQRVAYLLEQMRDWRAVHPRAKAKLYELAAVAWDNFVPEADILEASGLNLIEMRDAVQTSIRDDTLYEEALSASRRGE